MVWTVLLSVYVGACLLYWLWIAYAAVRITRDMPDLGKTQVAEDRDWPRLSVVVPACNEAEELASAVGTLLTQDYPDLEIVLVDDRSTDETGRIVDRLAAGDGRVKAIHVTELPEGWLGKVHAMHRGYQAATGQFVLLTDADVHFEPPALRKAVAYCLEHNLDHLAAVPKLHPASLVLESMIGVFIRAFLAFTRPWAVSDPKSRAFLGVGAFNLLRREAMDATEGLPWLRLETADDVGLGYMMKRSGARCAAVSAFALVWLHWYSSLGQAASGVEKGFASAFHFSFPVAMVKAGLILAFELSPLLGVLPVFRPDLPVAWAAPAVTALWALSTALLHRWARGRLLAVLLFPLAVPILAALSVRAGWLGWRRGGVMWRGTLYPSQVLRQGRRLILP
jgi:GT2 family glycosyltransferase